MEIRKQRKINAILRAIKNANRSLGSTNIAEEIQSMGIHLSHRTVRYYLSQMDTMGLTRKRSGRLGREITEKGEAELQDALVVDKVGLVASKMDDLSYKMTFSLKKRSGLVILNISLVDEASTDNVLKMMRPVFEKNLGMGQYLTIARGGGQIGEFKIPSGKTAIGTICSVVINGILIHEGIPVISKFGGILEIYHDEPYRFTEIIHYDGSSLDPLEIFIKGKMTSVRDAVQTGRGLIGASFREIPASALSHVRKLAKQLESIGLGAIIAMGKPNQPLLDIPVGEGRAGIIVAGGLNPLAAVEESGIQTENLAMGTLLDFSELVSYKG